MLLTIVEIKQTKFIILSQQKRDIGSMFETLVQLAAVYDVGPTLNQHWFNVSCLLGYFLSRRRFFKPPDPSTLQCTYCCRYVMATRPCGYGLWR